MDTRCAIRPSAATWLIAIWAGLSVYPLWFVCSTTTQTTPEEPSATLQLQGGRLVRLPDSSDGANWLAEVDQKSMLDDLTAQPAEVRDCIFDVSLQISQFDQEDANRLAALPNLRHVAIVGGRITAASLLALKDLPKLQSVDLIRVSQPYADSPLVEQLTSPTRPTFRIEQSAFEPIASSRASEASDVKSLYPSGSAASTARETKTREQPQIAAETTWIQLEQVVDCLESAALSLERTSSIRGGYLRTATIHGSETAWDQGSVVTIEHPGTPSVGRVLLDAYRVSGREEFLRLTRDVADALRATQLRTGGWKKGAEMDPIRAIGHAYRSHTYPSTRSATVLDDNTTQRALAFLIELDRELKFADPDIHEAVLFCLESIVISQFPNGAWPQWVKRREYDPRNLPIRSAAFPEKWSTRRTTAGYGYYRYFYTTNDALMADTIRVLLCAYEAYNDTRYRQAAIRGGEFLLLAQLPEPQPAWAQQYNSDMHPAWGRTFEPPGISARESQSTISALIELHHETGDPRFLRPVQAAISYLRRSKLPDGRLARFYEMETNRPLYVNRRYQLTYSDADLLSHYRYKTGNYLHKLEQHLQNVHSGREAGNEEPATVDPRQVHRILQSQETDGGWVEQSIIDGQTRLVVQLSTFLKNFELLTEYVAQQNALAQQVAP